MRHTRPHLIRQMSRPSAQRAKSDIVNSESFHIVGERRLALIPIIYFLRLSFIFSLNHFTDFHSLNANIIPNGTNMRPYSTMGTKIMP